MKLKIYKILLIYLYIQKEEEKYNVFLFENRFYFEYCVKIGSFFMNLVNVVVVCRNFIFYVVNFKFCVFYFFGYVF